MPELPDVEGFRRTAEAAAGAVVERVEVLDDAVLRNTSPGRLRRALEGHRLGHPGRRGKWLVLPFEGSVVVLHFGMTGSLRWSEHAEEDGRRHRHDRVVVATGAGELVYRDQRKLRGLWLAAHDDDVAAIVGPLGPDALGLGLDDLEAALAGHRGALKPLLMDQSVVAGLGNLTADEALWRARLHPRRRAGSLTRGERRALQRALSTVLRAATRRGAVPAAPGWLTSQRDRADPRCPRCGTALERLRVGGRAAVFCPRCQPAEA